jgi:tetratricopeptide (TPR) repeat protein
MLAKSFLNAGEIDSAYILYREIIEISPGDYDSYVFLGNYYYVIAKRVVRTDVNHDERRSRFFLSKREDGRTPDTHYHKAGEYLERAYMVYNSDEIRKSLIEIYTILGDRDKVTLYRRAAQNRGAK